jgi:carbon storage regulator CsrA
MLSLTRRIGEAIYGGDNQTATLEIRILGYEKGEVQIGLTAPQEMVLVRGEIDSRPRRFNTRDERA